MENCVEPTVDFNVPHQKSFGRQYQLHNLKTTELIDQEKHLIELLEIVGLKGIEFSDVHYAEIDFFVREKGGEAETREANESNRGSNSADSSGSNQCIECMRQLLQISVVPVEFRHPSTSSSLEQYVITVNSSFPRSALKRLRKDCWMLRVLASNRILQKMQQTKMKQKLSRIPIFSPPTTQ